MHQCGAQLVLNEPVEEGREADAPVLHQPLGVEHLVLPQVHDGDAVAEQLAAVLVAGAEEDNGLWIVVTPATSC